MGDIDYKYKGLPISPSMIEEIVIKLFSGKTQKRYVIVEEVITYHTSNGGLKPEAKDFSRSVKKALTNLQNKSLAINKAYGHWEISQSIETALKDDFILPKIEEITFEIPTHKIYGSGKSAVYLYYFPAYKKLADLKSENAWPCKIGRSDRDPLSRIFSQASTALPEKPTIEFIIKVDNPSSLENSIHDILHLRNKQLNDAPGTEWFSTSPEEILNIVNFINPKLLEEAYD